MIESIPEEDLAKFMEHAAGQAVVWAKEAYRKDLDFSVHSLATVEEILQTWSFSVPKTWLGRLLLRKAKRKDIQSMCLSVGAYIGEVIRRLFGGTWHQDNSFGAPTFALSFLEGKIFPIDKVGRRLLDGPGDSIWAYYQMLADMKEHPEKWPQQAGPADAGKTGPRR